MRWAVFSLVLTGCNTCLDSSSVPFIAGAEVADDAGPSVPDTAGLDARPDVADADIDACSGVSDEELCTAAGLTCGDHEQLDACGERIVACGTCSLNEICTDEGACVCAAGFERRDGGECVDVDECAIGADNCYDSSLCTNLDGGFACECPPGTEGDGVTCPPAAELVTKLQTVTTELEEGTNETSVILQDTWDVGSTVPFVSVRGGSSDAVPRNMFVDVSFEGPNTLRVRRRRDNAPLTVVLVLVEFGPGARVQSGTFSLGGQTEVVELDQDVDPARSFAVVTAAYNNDDDDGRSTHFAVRLNADHIDLSRGQGAGAHDGNWWVVESAADHFATTPLNIDIAGDELCGVADVESLDLERTFLLHSHMVGGTSVEFDADEIFISCQMSDAETLQCCRGGIGAGSTPLEATATAIEFAGNTTGWVETGSVVLDLGTSSVAATPTNVIGADTIGLLGSMAPAGQASNDYGLERELSSVFVTVEIADGDVVVERADSVSRSFAVWQLVNWPD